MKYFSEVNTGGGREKLGLAGLRAYGPAGLRACRDPKIILWEYRFIGKPAY